MVTIMISILRHKQRKILRFSLTIYDEYGTYQEDTRIPPFYPKNSTSLATARARWLMPFLMSAPSSANVWS